MNRLSITIEVQRKNQFWVRWTAVSQSREWLNVLWAWLIHSFICLFSCDFCVVLLFAIKMSQTNEEMNNSIVKRNSKLNQTFSIVIHIIDSIVLITILTLQQFWLSYHLVNHFDGTPNWYFAFFADFTLILLFIVETVFAAKLKFVSF